MVKFQFLAQFLVDYILQHVNISYSNINKMRINANMGKWWQNSVYYCYKMVSSKEERIPKIYYLKKKQKNCNVLLLSNLFCSVFSDK